MTAWEKPYWKQIVHTYILLNKNPKLQNSIKQKSPFLSLYSFKTKYIVMKKSIVLGIDNSVTEKCWNVAVIDMFLDSICPNSTLWYERDPRW